MIGYLWEIDLSSTDTIGTLAESLIFNFHTKYLSPKKPECFHDLSLEFTVNDYKVNMNYYLNFIFDMYLIIFLCRIDFNVN